MQVRSKSFKVEATQEDIYFQLMQRLIDSRGANKVKLHFAINRYDRVYWVRLIYYHSQKILVIWSETDRHDCDMIILDGNYKDLRKGIKNFDVDKCCCDECCTGCGQCIAATLCCMACVDKSDPKTSACPCAGESCVRRVAKIYYESNEPHINEIYRIQD